MLSLLVLAAANSFFGAQLVPLYNPDIIWKKINFILPTYEVSNLTRLGRHFVMLSW